MSSTVATTKSQAKKASTDKINHPTYDVMIGDAIKEIKDRKGAHRSAICNYLAKKYFDGDKPKAAILAKALKKSVESNHISLKAPQRYVLQAKVSTKKPAVMKAKAAIKKAVIKSVHSNINKKQPTEVKSTKSKRGTPVKKAVQAKKATPIKAAKSDTEE